MYIVEHPRGYENRHARRARKARHRHTVVMRAVKARKHSGRDWHAGAPGPRGWESPRLYRAELVEIFFDGVKIEGYG